MCDSTARARATPGTETERRETIVDLFANQPGYREAPLSLPPRPPSSPRPSSPVPLSAPTPGLGGSTTSSDKGFGGAENKGRERKTAPDGETKREANAQPRKKGRADPPQSVSEGIKQMYEMVRARMRKQAQDFMALHMKAIRANYLWFLAEHRNVGGPMGCYTNQEFTSGQLPAEARPSAVVTMLPVDRRRLTPTALVTSWMLPASLVHARKALLPRERAEIGETMSPRDVCLWFLVADQGLHTIKDYFSFYVPDGVRHLRDTKLTDSELALLFAKILDERART